MPLRLLVATGNPGKVKEYQTLARGSAVELAHMPGFPSLPTFEENAPTFAENAAGKALHYSRFVDAPVLADDSGLVVDALGGAPGPKSARYAGPNATDADRVTKLLAELRWKKGAQRRAAFVCVVAVAQKGRALAIVSDKVEGVLLDAPRGTGGFGYDPIFLYQPAGKTFAEMSGEEKNLVSHRGKAFRKLIEVLQRSEKGAVRT